MSQAPHQFSCRVYYEDTDMGGIVYHANYLKFIERARSDFVRQLGVDQLALRDAGVVFAVRKMAIEFLSPARFDEELTVLTEVLSLSGARMELGQTVMRGQERLFHADVTIAALTMDGKPTRLPAIIRQNLA